MEGIDWRTKKFDHIRGSWWVEMKKGVMLSSMMEVGLGSLVHTMVLVVTRAKVEERKCVVEST